MTRTSAREHRRPIRVELCGFHATPLGCIQQHAAWTSEVDGGLLNGCLKVLWLLGSLLPLPGLSITSKAYWLEFRYTAAEAADNPEKVAPLSPWHSTHRSQPHPRQPDRIHWGLWLDLWTKTMVSDLDSTVPSSDDVNEDVVWSERGQLQLHLFSVDVRGRVFEEGIGHWSWPLRTHAASVGGMTETVLVPIWQQLPANGTDRMRQLWLGECRSQMALHQRVLLHADVQPAMSPVAPIVNYMNTRGHCVGVVELRVQQACWPPAAWESAVLRRDPTMPSHTGAAVAPTALSQTASRHPSIMELRTILQESRVRMGALLTSSQ